MSEKFSPSLEIALHPADVAPFWILYALSAGALLTTLLARSLWLLAGLIGLMSLCPLLQVLQQHFRGALPRTLHWHQGQWFIETEQGGSLVAPTVKTTALGRAVFVVLRAEASQRRIYCVPLGLPWQSQAEETLRQLRVRLRLAGCL